MNNPEVTMHDALPNTGLIAHRKALEAAGIAINILRAENSMMKAREKNSPPGRAGHGIVPV